MGENNMGILPGQIRSIRCGVIFFVRSLSDFRIKNLDLLRAVLILLGTTNMLE